MKRTAMGAMALLIAASSLTVPSLASAAPYGGQAYDQGDRGRGHDDRGPGYNDHGKGHDKWDDSRHNGYRYKGKFYYGPPPAYRRDHVVYEYRSWRKGDRLPVYYRERYREIDWRSSRLREPPRGYHYVRDDRGETLLVGVATGVILGVILAGH